MDLEKVRRLVGKIKSNLFKNSNSYSIGMLKSHFRGTGLQFREHQIYTHGDDVRFIDWKMVAKTQTPYIKTFEEERNVEIVVIIDASITMFSGYDGTSKLQAAIELCCLLYLLAKETSDFVTAMIVSDEIITVPSKNGDAGIANFISTLERHKLLDASGKINFNFQHKKTLTSNEKISALNKHLSKKKEVVLLSDFNDFFELEILKKILYQRNVHCFQVLSPLDEAHRLPFMIKNTSIPTSKQSLSTIYFDGQDNLAKHFGKKIKKLKVHERYLESFIKEMV